MRAALAWLGFRDRWSALDSSGVSVLTIATQAVPVIHVGDDSDDGHESNVGGVEYNPGAGLFGRICFWPEADHWVKSVHVFYVQNPGTARFHLDLNRDPGPQFGLSAGFLSPNFGPHLFLFANLVPPSTIVPLIPIDTWVRFPEPGILVKGGERLEVGNGNAGDTFACTFTVRNA
jgi:hypothetical protein